MRRSLTVKLTILPLLAAAALAHADPPGDTPLQPQVYDGSGYAATDIELAPPGMAEVIAPTDCFDDPNAPWCPRPAHGTIVNVVRGGFGHYFWSGGG